MRRKIALCIVSILGTAELLWAMDPGASTGQPPKNNPQQNPPPYLGPSELIATQDGKILYVLCEDSKQVAVVDLPAGKPKAFWSLPGQPTGACLSPNQDRLYVTCAKPHGVVCVMELPSGRLSQEIPVGYWACGPSISPDGAKLYVCNRFQNSISVVDLAAGKEVARIPAVREPIASAITPDGKSLFVANHLPNDRADSYDVAAVVTVVDTATNRTRSIRLLNGSTSVRNISISADGRYVYVPHILARYQMPTTQLERGWMNTNALTILDAREKRRINTVLLDNVDLGAAIPWDVACTPDGRWICVSHYGTHELSVIDAPAMLEKLANLPEQLPSGPNAPYVDRSVGPASLVKEDVPNDLSFLVGLKRRIRLGGAPPYQDSPESAKIKGPRAVAIVGTKAYVAIYFSDLLCVVDLTENDVWKAQRSIVRLPLGPEPVWTLVRKGQLNFIDAALCFQQWQSCESCHPEGRVDGLNWDLLNDGLGNPKNNKSMVFAHKTPPAMWTGVRPTAEDAVRSGIRHIQFAVRPEEDAVAIDEYLKSLQPLPSPYLVNGQLSQAAQRGKKIFFDPEIGCATCHPEPLYTDMKMHNVNSRGPYDRQDEFDTPSLIECWRTAPYMHDGRYVTLKQVFTEGKHGSTFGKLEKLTPQQLEDLVEFLLSL